MRLRVEQALSLYAARNPFTSPQAVSRSIYSAPIGGVTTHLLDSRPPAARAKMVDGAMRRWILGDRFSCVAAKAAVASGGYRFGCYDRLGDEPSSEGLARDLCAFIAERPAMPVEYATFVAVFDQSDAGDERWFEISLWRQLQQLIRLSAPHWPWNPQCRTTLPNPTLRSASLERPFSWSECTLARRERRAAFFSPPSRSTHTRNSSALEILGAFPRFNNRCERESLPSKALLIPS